MQTNARFDDTVTERERRNRALALAAAVEGIVLLENDGTLPLTPGPLALFGAGAAYTIQGGSGSGEVNVRHAVNALEGLEAAGFTVTTKDWLRRYDALWKQGKADFLREQRKKLFPPGPRLMTDLLDAEYRYPSGDALTAQELRASGADTCVYILCRQSGEGHDRRDEPGSFRLTETETAHIRLCAGHYARFVLVLNSGAPLDLSPLDTVPGINALVYMNQLGMEGGSALAAVLTGAQTPSGKLAVTWAKRYADHPTAKDFGPYARDAAHARYREGIYVGYRYFDSFAVAPRYPFGYGKSYTEFSLSAVSAALQGTQVRLRAAVVNTGTRFAGKQVVQVYVSCPQNGQAKEYQRLAAFGKTGLLAPGAQETLDLVFPLAALASYDETTAETYLEAGNYLVRLGTSSRETAPAAVLTLARRTVLARHRHLCAAAGPVQQLWAPPRPAEALPAGLPELVVEPSLFRTVTYRYKEPEEHFSPAVEQHLAESTPAQMARFCAGAGLFGEGKGFCTPGAAGHTTAACLDRGIPNRELCDGPAGLRVQRRSTLGKGGKIKAVDAPISVYEYFPQALTRLLLGDPQRERVLYQFVTGFPVAAAVAQSWNTALARQIGQAVSAEMTEYGVTWWLAPALNIVRDPLCGRNYEYYSEDPLLSGQFAAAVTQGVQAAPGCFVTVKHFAANNQEQNRYYVSSDVDERALREIYLRGFEIVVRQAAPKAVMAAYNKLNGVYCANSRELCTDILRGEWGFAGLVMTDWLSTGGDRAQAAACPGAGVDLIMPGGKGTVRALRRACRAGQLSPAALRRSCGRVLEQILAGNGPEAK